CLLWSTVRQNSRQLPAGQGPSPGPGENCNQRTTWQGGFDNTFVFLLLTKLAGPEHIPLLRNSLLRHALPKRLCCFAVPWPPHPENLKFGKTVDGLNGLTTPYR